MSKMTKGTLCRTSLMGMLIVVGWTAARAGESIVRERPMEVQETPIEVRIELPKVTYALGEAITFVVTSNRDCYFLVFTIDPNDKVEVHDPVASGPYMGHPLLKSGERREIPVPDAPGRAVVTPPAGAYQIGAVCSREELGRLRLTDVQLKEPAKAGRRSFEFHLGQKIKEVDHNVLSQATIAYEVKAR